MDIEEIYKNDPLLVYSVYSVVQDQYLIRVGGELIDEFNQIESSVVNDFNNTYGKFWLWLLGSYEVIRTLWQDREQFSLEFSNELTKIKSEFAEVRMPFAKQEYRGRSERVKSDLSVVGLNSGFEFEIDGKTISATTLIHRYISFSKSITLEKLHA